MQTLARRRRMRHAISFLRVVVAVVIVVFALIGFLYVTRGGAVKRVRGVGVTSGTVSAALRAAGVEVVAFRPLRISMLNVAQNRSHVRAIVIDGRIGWTGGFGIDDKWLGDGRSNGGWRDTNVRFEGPAVRQLEAAFAAAWTEATGELLTGRITVPVARDGAVRAGLVYAPPTLGSTVAERFLALSVAAARKTLYITNPYFAPEDNFVDLLAAAARRGVDVRLLLSGPRTDIRLARRAARARYDRLLAAGVRVFEWQPTALHAKTFVVDELWSSVGTMNFDNRSLVLNEEVTLMVLDPAFGHDKMRCSSTTSSMPPRSRATSFGSDRGPNGWSNEVRTSSHACSES